MTQPPSRLHRSSSHVLTGLLAAYLLIACAWYLSGCAGVTTPNSGHTSNGLAVTLTSLPSAKVQTNYSASLTASGGILPYTWTVTTGNLPAGLALNSSSGL